MSISLKKVEKPNLTKAKCIVIIASKADSLKSYPFYKDNTKLINDKFKNGQNTIVNFHDKGQLWLVGINASKDTDKSNELEDLRKLGSDLTNAINKEKIAAATVVFTAKTMSETSNWSLIEGMLLMNYQFLKYKTNKKKNSLTKLEINGGHLNQSALNELTNLTSSVALARDLVNEPVITLNAPQLSKEITKAGKSAGFTTKVLTKATIQKLGMGGLLGVNAGSIDPPTFNILEWKPAKAVNKKPYILVGKGVVYDTGGNNLKPGSYMSTMKSDMGGSAAVTGTLNAIASNKLPIHVIGLIPATDNRIGKNAIVADDVLHMYDGSTVEVQNTDAEGRLILADALAYAKKYKPELVIDLATLTGAAAAIVGTFGIAMMGTADSKEKQALSAKGDEVYERLAEMPYWREYGDLLKSDIADIKNIGGPTGGAITAGKFLEHFTDYPWIHLDIAGPAFLNKAESYKPSGGTGVGVRLLYHFFKQKAKK